MNSQETIALGQANILPTYKRFPIAIDHGKGCRLYDPEGNEYLDFTSGIGVASLGYGDPAWVSAVSEQAARLAHVSNLFHTEPPARLAAELVRRTGMSGVFFANGGGEANEGLIKCARKYSHDRYGDGRATVVSLVQSFHGRTVTTLAATGQDVFHQHFFPFTEGFVHVAANDAAALDEALTPDVCAVMVELVQGEGGVLPLSQDYVDHLATVCAERDILLCVDEVQTGVGRTGSLFAFERYGIQPDIVSFAKGIAGGLPMGGIMVGNRCKDVLGPGDHATTFGGNPVAAAGALVVLDRMDDTFLADVAAKGDYLRAQVRSWNSPHVTDVRGAGLMVGIEVDIAPGEVVSRCIERGLLALTAGSSAVRLLPPLVITRDEIDEGLAILREAIES